MDRVKEETHLASPRRAARAAASRGSSGHRVATRLPSARADGGVAAPATRREAAHTSPVTVRHRRRRIARIRGLVVLSGGGILILWAVIALVGSAIAPDAGAQRAAAPAPAAAPPATGIPVPVVVQAVSGDDAPAADDSAQPVAPAPGTCADPELQAAVASRDDAAAIASAGGGSAFRDAVVAGSAGCVDLADPSRLWMVVNKTRPYVPIDYIPSPLVAAADVQRMGQGILRQDAAAALTAMVGAARAAGAGEIGLQNGYRSHGMQASIYDGHVDDLGVADAEHVSARPGFSEHQSGLAVDVVPCDEACGELDDLAGTSQDEWIRAHSWEYGWIVRYEDGYTAISGYTHEPWHLRYVGADLARAYREGGFHTLEEFFGLPAAARYAE